MQAEQRVWPHGMDMGTLPSSDKVWKHTGHSQALRPAKAADDVMATCTTEVELAVKKVVFNNQSTTHLLPPLSRSDMYRDPSLYIHTYKHTLMDAALYLERTN